MRNSSATGSQRIRLIEVELELKSGNSSGLYDLATRVVLELPFSLDFSSKAEKGFRTMNHQPPAPVKANPVHLNRNATVRRRPSYRGDGRAALAVCRKLGRVRLSRGDPPASRRTSPHWRCSGGRLPPPSSIFCGARPSASRRLKDRPVKSRSCRRRMGRDQCRAPGSTPGCDALFAAIVECERDRNRQVRGVIDNRATTLFVLAIGEVILGDGVPGVSSLASSDLSNLSMPANHKAHVSLGQGAQARVETRTQNPHALGRGAWSAWASRSKICGYGIEFFSSLFGHQRQAEAVLEAIKPAAGVCLGAHMMRSTREVAGGIVLPALSREVLHATGYIAGWYAHGVPIADARLAQAWKKFERTKAFWQ